MKTKDVMQICSVCGDEFLLRYCENGAYDYVSEPCGCECDFSPVEGEPSISQWLESI